jgi:hypothetical protein
MLATTLRSTLTTLSANSVGGWQALTTALTVAAGPNSSLQFGQRLQVLIACGLHADCMRIACGLHADCMLMASSGPYR